MINQKKLFLLFAAIVAVFAAGRIMDVRAASTTALSQPDFSSVQSEGWGSYTAAIGIASGTLSEVGTTTAALGTFSMAYLGWECDMRIENYAVPAWCGHYIPLTVATTTMLGTGTMAYVFQNPHQAVDGDVELYYVEFYGGNPNYMGFGASANTTRGLSWSWTCGSYCRSGGILGGTSNDFVPYLEIGPQADLPVVSLLSQANSRGEDVPEGGMVAGDSVVLGAVLGSSVSDPVVLQVEVEPAGVPFAGIPTASSTAAAVTSASVTVSALADGSYHWAARAVDADTLLASPWTSFSPSGAASDFVVQKPKEPVVFIPGIVGTRLMRAGDGKEIWPNINDMLISPNDAYLDDLSLASDGSQISGKEMVPTSIIDQESVLGVSIPFYQNILKAFAADGYRSGTSFFPVSYDWRRGVRNAAGTLAGVISDARAASPDGKISIIGYSMGGLVAKEYLAGLSDTSFINKLILVGAPQLGSPESFKVLNYGDNLGFQVPIVNMDILNHAETKKIAQNMPSIYDLLPSRVYLRDDGGYVQDFRNGGSSILDYEATNRFMTDRASDSRNGSLLAAADDLHDGLDDASLNAADVYNIVGCSEPTISGYRVYDGGVVDVSRSEGDGTVPLASAMDRADGFKNYFISGSKTGITHASLVSDPRSLALIKSILDGRESSFPFPDGFSASLDSCFSDAVRAPEIEFSAHGAAGFKVQDGNGKFVGVDASGTVELGVPDSTYDVMGDNYFIMVPADGDYHLIAESSSSDFVLQAKGYDGADVTQTATYIVPSAGSDAVGANIATSTESLDFHGFSSAGDLEVLKSGNATATISVLPIMQASSSEDVAPPEISISGVPETALRGSTTTVLFSATDTDSGVASLRATLNGVPIASGDTIVFSETGRNIFRVDAIDGSGNPAGKEIDVQVSVPPHEVSFLPIADTYINGNVPDMNYGSSSILRLRARGRNRALMRFDDTAIARAVGSSMLMRATLTLSIGKKWQNFARAEVLGLYQAADPWMEFGATWSDVVGAGNVFSPALLATSTVGSEASGTILFDIATSTPLFSDDPEGSSLMLRKIDECAPGVIDFDSRESSAPPLLTLVLQ